MKKTRRQGPSRERLATVGEDGSRLVVHPADTRGRFTVLRRVAAVLLIAVYVLLPWIPVNGYPAVFFDLANLRFHLFGATLSVHDLWLGFFLITGLAFSLFFVTALFGRIWCGWACPQTVFLEHVFRRIERFLEGDAVARKRLDQSPWTAEKFLRRGTKHVLFLVCAALIAHILLSYFVSIPGLWGMITHSPLEHWRPFVFIVIATGLLYFNFSWFREQLCIIICPYGRLQSALIDDDSIVIGYDEKRGEPRGRTHGRERDPHLGDCVDCFRCVQVCPTGIDIRQGLQLECIGCANCIDACDKVMDRLGRPRGLIRYDSLNGLAGKPRRILRPRIILYTVLLVIGLVVASVSISRYEPATFNIVRLQGAAYYVDETSVRNQFTVRVINKTMESQRYTLEARPAADGIEGFSIVGWDAPVTVEANGEVVRPLVLRIARGAYNGGFPVRVELHDEGGTVALSHTVEFIGPDPRLFKAHEKAVP
ncbi:MAG: cytochrome c oxidase accessory protein CcoG [Verrucomicrobia bacterium]|nr:MAG: cytochrome c oxidase accessory protein CcoG [Verrucomicrobiota bacterium]